MGGDFISTLTSVEISSGWTELRAAASESVGLIVDEEDSLASLWPSIRVGGRVPPLLECGLRANWYLSSE